MLKWIKELFTKKVITKKILDKDVYIDDYNLFEQYYNKWCLKVFNKIYPITYKNTINFLEFYVEYCYQPHPECEGYFCEYWNGSIIHRNLKVYESVTTPFFTNISQHKGGNIYEYYFLTDAVKRNLLYFLNDKDDNRTNNT